MRSQIQSYLEAHETAWSSTTWKSERSRLNAVADVIDQGPEALMNSIKAKKPYTIKTTFIRVCRFEAWIGQSTSYRDYMRKHANRFKHAYQKKELGITFDEASRKIEGLEGTAKSLANFLLRSGLRISEVDSRESDRVVGKGGKVRKYFAEAPSTACSKYELRRALRECGLKPHDLRKLFATKLADSGATAADLCKALGWSDIKTAMVYLQAKDDTRLEQFIHEATK